MTTERGSASVFVLAAAASVLLAAVPVVLVASLLASHRQAVRAADLAALAGAQHSLTDVSVACAWARRVASANGAELRHCDMQELSLHVQVSIRTDVPLVSAVSAEARAGIR